MQKVFAKDFIGRNIVPQLKNKYDVLTPSRQELNLFDRKAIESYILNNNIDVIVHSANPNPSKNSLDIDTKMLRDSLEIFLNIYNSRKLVKKVIIIGSGASYDKTKDIVSVKENQIFDSIPKDDYGFAKYIMNYFCNDNVYNLCVFGCYGPSDASSKFITHCIRCIMRGEDITIRQNCYFDYMHVSDLGRIMSWLIDNEPKHNIYNAVSGKRVSLLEIANKVKELMNSNASIIIAKDGLNNEYTASNELLLEEYNGQFTSLEDGILQQIDWEKNNI